jgi:hypothetical protein
MKKRDETPARAISTSSRLPERYLGRRVSRGEGSGQA